MKYTYNYDYEVECDTIYDLIVNHYMTLREVESQIGLSKSTIRRRIQYMKFYHRRRYFQIERILEYNKEFKFKKKCLWDKEINQDWKEYINEDHI